MSAYNVKFKIATTHGCLAKRCPSFRLSCLKIEIGKTRASPARVFNSAHKI